MASHFPNQVQPNKYLQMWWGIQQERSEPFAAYVPRVIKLIETVTGQGVPMWSKEDRHILSDLFHKGLWDFETNNMDHYFPSPTMAGSTPGGSG